MNKNVGIVLGIIVIVGIGYLALSGNKTRTDNVGDEITNNMPAPDSNVPEMVVETEQNATTTTTAGSYVAYSSDKIAMAATGDVVLFFHAVWCPSCKALNGDIEKNMSAIPAGVTILKADYDKEAELKKKYGVTYQHTLVQVDKDGNMIKKWSGGSKLENLISQIQ